MSNLICEEIVHIVGYPKKLIVFLHGYIDNASTVEKALLPMLGELSDVAVHIPEAPYICEIHESKRQWYSMHRFDPNDDRKVVPSLKECTAIYDKMGLGLIEADSYLSTYINDALNEYSLENKDLFICGYSQGATLSIYWSLMREEKIGGCVSFGGICAPKAYLEKHHQSSPDFLLVHGTDDNLVRYDVLDYTKKVLQKMQCKVNTKTIQGGQHRLSTDGLKAMLKFIKDRI